MGKGIAAWKHQDLFDAMKLRGIYFASDFAKNQGSSSNIAIDNHVCFAFCSQQGKAYLLGFQLRTGSTGMKNSAAYPRGFAQFLAKQHARFLET